MYIIDRFEGNYAVIEDGNKKMVQVLREKLPKQAKEGDCLVLQGENYVFDEKATLERKQHVRKLMDSLFE